MSARRQDDGATLIIVLMIVTVVSLVMGVVLSQGETSIRTTIALRDQASKNYAGDAAAQAVVTQLRNGKLDCSTPTATNTALGTGTTSPFYTPVSTQDGPLNASATCLPDTVNGVTTQTVVTGTGVTIDQNNTLGYALLTVGSTTGQIVRGNLPTCIAGGSVVSNSDITLANRGAMNSLKVGKATSTSSCSLATDPTITVTAASATGCNGQATDSTAADFAPTPCTHAAIAVPSSTWINLAPKPTTGYTVTDPPPLCDTTGTYAAFRPGKYTQIPGTTSASACSSASFQWFTPGTYYFDLTSQWTWPSTLVGGTPQDTNGTVIASLVNFDVTVAANASKLAALSAVTKFPGSCADPAVQSTYPGVEFVMGGSSTILPNASGNNELCATYSPTGIPVGLYGVSQDVAGGPSMSLPGGGSISAETLCTTPPCTSSSTGGASLIATASAGNNSIYLQGYLYAPSAPLTIVFFHNVGLLLGWGLVVRSFDFTENGASLKTPFVAYRPVLRQGQTTTTVTTYSIRYISVWTCLATSSPCSQSGPPNVRVRVQTSASGDIKVLSWSNLH